MRENSGLEDRTRSPRRKYPRCWIAATPAVRKRLLGLAVAVLAPAVLPVEAGAQSSAGGAVRLIIRADALDPSGSAVDPEPAVSALSEPASNAEEPVQTTASRAEEDLAGTRPMTSTSLTPEPILLELLQTEPIVSEPALAGQVAGGPLALEPDSIARRSDPESYAERRPD